MNETNLLVPHPSEILYGHGTSLACDLDGQISAEALQGFFAGDTRVMSTYRMTIGGASWQVLGRTRFSSSMARWTFQNPAVKELSGEITEGTLFLSLERRVIGAMYDDLRILAFPERPVNFRLSLQIDADFADIFQVKDQTLPPRLNVTRTLIDDGLMLEYSHKGFHRGLKIRFRSKCGIPHFNSTQVLFDLNLGPGDEWWCWMDAEPIIDRKIVAFGGDRHGAVLQPIVPINGPEIVAAPLLRKPFVRGLEDLHALAVPQVGNPPFPAAGVPWFFTLFGRDTLISSLMSGLDGAWKAEGTLAALGSRQALTRNDWRDAEPGKFPHEIRTGELAFEGIIPHAAYYGTHDAPALFCLTLWQAWRWTGKRRLLDAHLETARVALRWCDELGDRDGDGLLEYATRSRQGYYNQGWKDSGDAILHADGTLAETPLATVELQAYLYAARLAVAELLEEIGDSSSAKKLRDDAARLRHLVEERYWMEDENFYAVALNRTKSPVRSISSNPGHLLWCGLPRCDRAARVALRFLEKDMFTGWGLRSLSAKNPAYNPLAYQRGSVWPFDTALAAAGLWRYGWREEASILLRSILEAASAFELARLPELFCGLDRSFGPPVPYIKANTPQAWSAATPILAAQLFLGILPDAPRRRCFISPWLPDWLPTLELKKVVIGSGTLDIKIARQGGRTEISEVRACGVEVIEDMPASPLWGEIF